MALLVVSHSLQLRNPFPIPLHLGQAFRCVDGGKTHAASLCRMDYLFSDRVSSKVRAAASTTSSGGQSSFEIFKEPREDQISQSTSHDKMECFPGTELGNPIGRDSSQLLYKPYMDHLWGTLLETMPDLHCLPLEPDMRRKESNKGVVGSRVFNWLLAANRLRRIRLTYFDGGSSVQAFNGLLYPDFRYDIPLLGIDLLSFGASKILCVIDFTPLSQDPAYLDKYTNQLAPIRGKIAKYCGRMTAKFYDENQFFSKELLFFRSNLGAKDPMLEVPGGLLFKAYVGYINCYLQVLQGAKACDHPPEMEHVASRQAAYDKYSEERDPAIKLFSTYFGKEWTERFSKDFLFPATRIW